MITKDNQWFDDQPAPCCRQLRIKSMYYRTDERPGLLHNEEAMGYWCAHTNDALGPDGHAACHTDCQAGRGCFEED